MKDINDRNDKMDKKDKMDTRVWVSKGQEKQEG